MKRQSQWFGRDRGGFSHHAMLLPFLPRWLEWLVVTFSLPDQDVPHLRSRLLGRKEYNVFMITSISFIIMF